MFHPIQVFFTAQSWSFSGWNWK